MKKSDIAMIILIASVGVIIAYFISINLSFLKPPEEGIKVQKITTIDPNVTQPDKDIFNSDAINPTVEVILTPKDSN